MKLLEIRGIEKKTDKNLKKHLCILKPMIKTSAVAGLSINGLIVGT
jgi:hypothetical protein